MADIEHAAHHHAHLDKIKNGHREHAAEGGVGQDDGGTEHHAELLADGAVGDHIEDQAKRLDLRRNPAQIGNHDA